MSRFSYDNSSNIFIGLLALSRIILLKFVYLLNVHVKVRNLSAHLYQVQKIKNDWSDGHHAFVHARSGPCCPSSLEIKINKKYHNNKAFITYVSLTMKWQLKLLNEDFITF